MAADLSGVKALIKIHCKKADMSDGDATALAEGAVKDLRKDIPELIGDDAALASWTSALAARGAYRYFLGDIGSVRDEKRAAVFLRSYRDDVYGGNPGS